MTAGFNRGTIPALLVSWDEDMGYRRFFLIVGATLLTACSGGNGDQPAPAAEPAAETPAAGADTEILAANEPAAMARVFIISPENGATITGPVTVVFGIEGYSIAPAGTDEEGTGHHHLLVDTDLPPAGQPIPADENHLHFGKGQTETTLELAPGDHTLQLLLGDGNHVPHSVALISDPIVITVAVE